MHLTTLFRVLNPHQKCLKAKVKNLHIVKVSDPGVQTFCIEKDSHMDAI